EDAAARRAARGLVRFTLNDGTVADVEPWKASVIEATRCGLADDGSMTMFRPGYRFAADAAAGFEAKREAYEAGVKDLTDAWRTPADAAPPVGSGESRGQREGDVCTVRSGGVGEGSPGHLRMVNGKLECVPDRADGASPPRTMSAEDAQKIRDRAYF